MYPRYIVVLLLLAGIAGCGGGYSGVPVSGKVTLNQKPLANANIAFYPIVDLTQKEPPYSYGKTDANGQFTLKLSNNDADGAVIGKHRVSITMENGDEDKGDAQSGPEKKSIIPLRYQGTASKLIFEVPAGGADNANFNLISP